MKIKISLYVKTPDYDARILEREFRDFVEKLDQDGASELIDFSVKELKKSDFGGTRHER